MLCFNNSFFNKALWVIVSWHESSLYEVEDELTLLPGIDKELEESPTLDGLLFELSWKRRRAGDLLVESSNGDDAIEAYRVDHSVSVWRIGI